MASLIEQIQRDCIDKSTSVSDLLRKVKLAAAKLGVAEIEEWVTNELEGYKAEAPDHRILRGTPMGFEPLTGHRPLIGSMTEVLSKKAVGEPIASIEEMLSSKSKSFIVTYPAEIVEMLNTANDASAHYYLQVSRGQLVQIVDRVRTLVLDWTTRLEKAGVAGTEFTFSESDKQKAQDAAMHVNIGTVENFTGNLGHGNVSGAITSSGLDVEGVRALVAEMRRYAAELVNAGAKADALDAKIGAIETELGNAKPDQSILRGLVNDVRNALSGAAGNIIASGVLYKIGRLLGV